MKYVQERDEGVDTRGRDMLAQYVVRSALSMFRSVLEMNFCCQRSSCALQHHLSQASQLIAKPCSLAPTTEASSMTMAPWTIHHGCRPRQSFAGLSVVCRRCLHLPIPAPSGSADAVPHFSGGCASLGTSHRPNNRHFWKVWEFSNGVCERRVLTLSGFCGYEPLGKVVSSNTRCITWHGAWHNSSPGDLAL